MPAASPSSTSPPSRSARAISGIFWRSSTGTRSSTAAPPPKFSWKCHILFFEDIQVDVKDLHRLLSALRRHNVFAEIKGIVIGSVSPPGKNSSSKKPRRDADRFILSYLADVIKERRRRGRPLPILTLSNFGPDIRRNLMAVPIGGHVTISRSKRISFRLKKRPVGNGSAA